MKNIFLTVLTALVLSLLGPALMQDSTVYAACGETGSKAQVLKGLNATGNDCNTGGVTNFASAVVEIISIIAGIVAILMILISAFKYMTSAGESSKIASAKTTLIYALVGLVIAALAQVLVNLVLSESSRAVEQSQSQPANNGNGNNGNGNNIGNSGG